MRGLRARGSMSAAYAIAKGFAHPALIPAIRYVDPGAAADWLCSAFGFKPYQIFTDDDDHVVHAELAYGMNIIMISLKSKSDFDRFIKLPKQARGVTSSIYVLVEDVDDHHDHAKAAGAEILLEPEDQDYGGRDYTCRDLEGHVWSFGTYNPWHRG